MKNHHYRFEHSRTRMYYFMEIRPIGIFTTMFTNYFKIIARNLWRNKLYTLINIIGLGVGIATMIWGFQNYRFSFSYDNFHKDKEYIFRALIKIAGSDDLKGPCPMPLATFAKNDFPVVKETVRW